MLTTPFGLESHDPSFSYEKSPDLYLFTSLTVGSSKAISATSRIETILKANRIPFKAVDCATDAKARSIWGRRSGGRDLPGLVKEGMVLGGKDEVDEWNEYGEIKMRLGGQQPQQPQVQQQPQQIKQENVPPAPAPAPAPAAAAQSSAKASEPQVTKVEKKDPNPEELAQQQRSTLASEAAAAAKLRNKTNLQNLKASLNSSPSTAPESTAASTSPQATNTTATDDSKTQANPTSNPATDSTSHPASTPDQVYAPRKSTSPPSSLSQGSRTSLNLGRSPERDIDIDLDKPSIHNTSTSAALPPLNTRGRGSSLGKSSQKSVDISQEKDKDSDKADPEDDSDDLEEASSKGREAPPPTAMSPSTGKGMNISLETLSASRAESARMGEQTHAAGPSAKSGAAAISAAHDPESQAPQLSQKDTETLSQKAQNLTVDNNASSSSSPSSSSSEEVSKQEEDKKDGTVISPVPDTKAKELERGTSINEVPDREGDSMTSTNEKKNGNGNGNGQRVQFKAAKGDEDMKKGAGAQEDKAGESVGD